MSLRDIFRSGLLPVNDVVERSLELCQYQIASGRVVLEKTLEPDLPRVLGDATQLRQVIHNLLLAHGGGVAAVIARAAGPAGPYNMSPSTG